MEWSHDLPWQTSAATPTPKGLVEYHRENGHHRHPPQMRRRGRMPGLAKSSKSTALTWHDGSVRRCA
jgi:hypothetical protein